MTVADILARARSQIGLKTIYKLGAGGISPALTRPVNVSGECDCSGYVTWCLGISRQTKDPKYVAFNGGWINTDAMVKDAATPAGLFEKIGAPKQGCLVVFGAKAGVRKVGHVALVSRVVEGKVAKVIHCSSGNYRSTGDAIQETGPAVFDQPDAIFAWPLAAGGSWSVGDPVWPPGTVDREPGEEPML